MKLQPFKFNLVAQLMLLLTVSFNVNADTWNQISSGTQKKLNTIDFPSSSVGYIGGNDSLLLKTTDGGVSWQKLNFSGITFLPGGEHIINMQFVNDTVGFITVGPYSGSYKTVNGGLTWTALPLPGNMCYNQGLFFSDENNGFIGGSGCFQGEIISQLAAGTWNTTVLNSIGFNPSNMITSFDFSPTLGLAGSRSGYIFRSVNGGISWDSVPAASNLNPITCVLIVNDTLAYAGYEALSTGFGLYISTDGGQSWAQDNNSATFFYPDFFTLHQSGNKTIYSGGYSQSSTTGLIFNKPNQVMLWNYDAVDQKINDVSSYHDSVVFGIGDSGYIVVNKPLATLGIRNNSNQGAEMSVFPNPSNGLVTILPEALNRNEVTQLNVYTVMGNCVLNTDFQTLLDLSKFEAGVYIIELVANGKFYRSKLMLE